MTTLVLVRAAQAVNDVGVDEGYLQEVNDADVTEAYLEQIDGTGVCPQEIDDGDVHSYLEEGCF